jgi:hypothetical protein
LAPRLHARFKIIGIRLWIGAIIVFTAVVINA